MAQSGNESYKLKINKPIGVRCHLVVVSSRFSPPRPTFDVVLQQYLHKCSANCWDYVGKFLIEIGEVFRMPTDGLHLFIIQFSLYFSSSLSHLPSVISIVYQTNAIFTWFIMIAAHQRTKCVHTVYTVHGLYTLGAWRKFRSAFDIFFFHAVARCLPALSCQWNELKQ